MFYKQDQEKFHSPLDITIKSVVFFIGGLAGFGSVLFALAILVDLLFLHIDNPLMWVLVATLPVIPLGIYTIAEDVNSNMNRMKRHYDARIRLLEIDIEALSKISEFTEEAIHKTHKTKP